jgi:predicted DNA repair protein MutK
MAGSSLLALIDDIATLLDDVAILTRVAAQKTAGVLGDDLALNAEQVSGVKADRELPVIRAVAKGSAVNKTILVPAAMLISALAPWAIMPLMMIGGLYLCYEGVEKLAHKFLHSAKEDAAHHAQLVAAMSDPQVDMVAFEKARIKGAIRTDFVLSAEIIVITLGTVAAATLGRQFAVLVGISVLMTVGVYGLVAGIIKLDDAGLHLHSKTGDGIRARFQRALGRGLLGFAPYLMHGLSIVGTAAMFMVGGGILTHGLHAVGETFAGWSQSIAYLPAVGGLLGAVSPVLLDAAFGVLAGIVALGAVGLLARLFKAMRPSPASAPE